MGNDLNTEQLSYTKKDAEKIFSKIAPVYDLNNTILSFGIHHLWKRKLIKKIKSKLHSDGFLIDLCTGTGDVLSGIGASYNALGIDFCAEMLEIARRKVPSNHQLQIGNVLNLDIADNQADIVSIAFGVRNLSNLEKGLSEIHRITKKNGYIYILEFGTPSNFILKNFYSFYSHFFLTYIGKILSGDTAAYKYLSKTSLEFPSNKTFKLYLEERHFKNISVYPLSLGIAYLYSMQPDK